MRGHALAAVLATTALLAGCSGGSDGDPAPAGASDPAAVQWSPCDDLTAAGVSTIVGEDVVEQNGTADQPRCTFTPKQKGGAAYDVSYLYYDGGLDAALDAMGTTGTQLKPVDVPGAKAARVAVRAKKDGVAVTGFVETQGLVQSVNAAQLAPYDESNITDATTALLAELARKAPSTDRMSG
ncbi:hypothetical protein ABLE68_09415 [Nocardioides sp. CN2-186]|uniref:hypothetical protein n=1 Tax=Nocardioides tweenelious TaxID=3156607 RepID=UPI0032B365AB